MASDGSERSPDQERGGHRSALQPNERARQRTVHLLSTQLTVLTGDDSNRTNERASMLSAFTAHGRAFEMHSHRLPSRFNWVAAVSLPLGCDFSGCTERTQCHTLTRK